MSVGNAHKSRVECVHKTEHLRLRRYSAEPQKLRADHICIGPVDSQLQAAFSRKAVLLFPRRKSEVSSCFRYSAYTPERFSSEHEQTNTTLDSSDHKFVFLIMNEF